MIIQPIAVAKLNYLKIAPRKVRLIINLLKGLNVNEAEAQLLFSKKRAGEPLIKLLRSAVANAKNKGYNDLDRLYISDIKVDKGSMLKRWLPRAQGRATPIQKKTSHIYLELNEMPESKFKTPKYKIPQKEKKDKKVKELSKKQKKKKEVPETMMPEKKSPTGKKKIGGFVRKFFRRKAI